MSEIKDQSWFISALRIDGSTLPVILPRIAVFGGFGFVVSLVHALRPLVELNILGDLTTNVACNLVLGLLLVFRTNTAYDKFWEGRKAWGMLVVNSRNLIREIRVGMTAADPQKQQEKAGALKLLPAFAIATRLHLRKQPIQQELDDFLSEEAIATLRQAKNPPMQITLWIGDCLQQWFKTHQIDADQRWAMSTLLGNLVEGLTSCERISTTPAPPAYGIYLKRLILIYCLLLPFGLVERLNWWTGFVTALISFVLLGVEAIGNQIEDPFGTDPNDLPLEDLCNTILESAESAIALPTASEHDIAKLLS